METGTGTQWKAAFPLQKGIMRKEFTKMQM